MLTAVGFFICEMAQFRFIIYAVKGHQLFWYSMWGLHYQSPAQESIPYLSPTSLI